MAAIPPPTPNNRKVGQLEHGRVLGSKDTFEQVYLAEREKNDSLKTENAALKSENGVLRLKLLDLGVAIEEGDVDTSIETVETASRETTAGSSFEDIEDEAILPVPAATTQQEIMNVQNNIAMLQAQMDQLLAKKEAEAQAEQALEDERIRLEAERRREERNARREVDRQRRETGRVTGIATTGGKQTKAKRK